jgi:hypothetical protein
MLTEKQTCSLESLKVNLRLDCSKLTYEKCTNFKCLTRGGYRKGETPLDYDIATCEALEQHQALTELLNQQK